MRHLIDWELLAELAEPPGFDQAPMWDAFARRYDGYSRLQEQSTRLQVQALGLRPTDSLLDVGAGPGRLSIEASRSVRSVTALDVSRAMLDALENNARAAHANNVVPLHLSWRDAEIGRNLGMHDVVVASRSPAMRDLVKLDAAARRAVFIMLFAGPSLKQFHDKLMEGIDPAPPSVSPMQRYQPSGHVLVFNRLAAMGIEASVNYLPDGFSRWYEDLDAVLADFDWLDVPPAHRDRFIRNIGPFLFEENGGLRLHMASRTVVVSWTKPSDAQVRKGGA